jgi:ribonuclease HI
MKVTNRLWEEGPGEISVYVDGCARGNPGHAGCGVIVRDASGRIVMKKGRYLGSRTNNVAEYMALIDAMREAVDLGAHTVKVFTDSELVVKQMTGAYRVKDSKLKELFAEGQRLSRGFSRVEFVHVTRNRNREADSLANEAVDDFLGTRAQGSLTQAESSHASEAPPDAGTAGESKI